MLSQINPLNTTYPGFTLIELLVVIAILAVLSTLGISNFSSSKTKAKDISRKADLSTIAKSLETYANDYRFYPLSSANHKIICQSTDTECDWGEIFADSKGTVYTAKLPSDPGGYEYYYSSNGTSYELYAHLENTTDQSISTYPGIMCGTLECNYKITSSNQ